MFGRRALSLITPILTGLVFVALLPIAAAQEEEDPKVLKEKLKEITKAVEAQYKDKKERDADVIIDLYGQLEALYPKLAKGEQKSVVKLIRKGFELRRPIKDREFMVTGAACLSGMGKEGLKALFKALDSKSIEPSDEKDQGEVHQCVRVKAYIIEGIGRTKDTSALDKLYKLLWHDDAKVIIAACKACSFYNEEVLKVKKDIVSNLIKVYSTIYTQGTDVDQKKPQYREKLVATEVAFNDALQKLTFQSFETAPEWQKWFNDNKGKKKW